MSIDTESKSRSEHAQQKLYLLYHEIRPSGSKYSYVIDDKEFDRHLDLFLSLRKSHHGLWPEVTFDDGHVSNLEYALPSLQARNLQAHFFITVGWTGRKLGYMGWSELRSLHESNQLIGAHGWTHTLLTHCRDKDLKMELSDARLMLEDKLGTSITTMSLPGGRYNQRILAACAEAGYTQVYSSIPRSELSSGQSLIGRLNIRGDIKPEWLTELLRPESGVLANLHRQYKVKETMKGLMGDKFYAKVWGLLNRQESDMNDSEI